MQPCDFYFFYHVMHHAVCRVQTLYLGSLCFLSARSLFPARLQALYELSYILQGHVHPALPKNLIYIASTQKKFKSKIIYFLSKPQTSEKSTL